MMKNLLTPILILLLSLLTFNGCQTGPDGGGNIITPDRVEKVTALAAYGGALYAQAQQPGSGPALIKARDGACALATQEKWDLVTLAAILGSAGLGNLNSSEGQIILTGLPLFIDLFSDQQVNLGDNEYARAVVKGACRGLTLAYPNDPIGGTPVPRPDKAATIKRLTDEAIAARGRTR